MPQRDELFRRFGPLFIESVMLMTLDAINELRVKAGLTPYTKQQVMDKMENHLSTLEPYDWMQP
jgi:hypothetical protein